MSHDPDWVRREAAALSTLVPAGLDVDGQVQVAASTWFVYGHISYDGEVVVGGYQDAATAAEVLQALPRAPGTPLTAHSRKDRDHEDRRHRR